MVDVLDIIKKVVGKAQANNKKNLELREKEPTSCLFEEKLQK